MLFLAIDSFDLAIDAALAASAALLLVPLHRDCGDLSKLSHAKSGKHYRSDPVRVQSTREFEARLLCSNFREKGYAPATSVFRLPRKRELPQSEIMLWTTPEEPPRALQASECHELLDLARTRFMIRAQRQPGKFIDQGHADRLPLLLVATIWCQHNRGHVSLRQNQNAAATGTPFKYTAQNPV